MGFDAYEKAIACDVDVVILATPPGFRPIHFEAAVQADKDIFMEKPVAVDAPGVRRVLEQALAYGEEMHLAEITFSDVEILELPWQDSAEEEMPWQVSAEEEEE